jgi:hypothetical protein
MEILLALVVITAGASMSSTTQPLAALLAEHSVHPDSRQIPFLTAWPRRPSHRVFPTLLGEMFKELGDIVGVVGLSGKLQYFSMLLDVS